MGDKISAESADFFKGSGEKLGIFEDQEAFFFQYDDGQLNDLLEQWEEMHQDTEETGALRDEIARREKLDREATLATTEEVASGIKSAKDKGYRIEVSIGASNTTLPDPKKRVRYICFDPGYNEDDQIPSEEDDPVQIIMDEMGKSPYSCSIRKPKDKLLPLAKKGVLFSNRPGDKTELPDSCADAVKIVNVFTDARTEEREIKRITKEAVRILKNGGRIYLAGTNTPGVFSLKDAIKLVEEIKLPKGTSLRIMGIKHLEEGRNLASSDVKNYNVVESFGLADERLRGDEIIHGFAIPAAGSYFLDIEVVKK